MLVPYDAFIKNILKKGTSMSLLKYKNKLMGQAINLKNIFQSKAKKQTAQPNTINTIRADRASSFTRLNQDVFICISSPMHVVSSRGPYVACGNELASQPAVVDGANTVMLTIAQHGAGFTVEV